MNSLRTTEFLQSFTAWAGARPDVLAAAVVGSHARREARTDSDIDLVLVCARRADFLADLSWTLLFGDVREHRLEDYGKVTSVRAWYEDGPEVEYGITDEDWVAVPLDEGTRRVMLDGMQVLFEQADLLSRMQPAQPAAGPA